MLTEIKAYSSRQSASTLLLDDNGRAETDLIQIRNVEGLNPVKASISGAPLAVIDGMSFNGSSVLSRNIVLTLHPNPDWQNWSHEALRKLLYTYFMPKSLIHLRFYGDDMVPVEIEGYVEDVSNNLFSKDPEIFISIICPNPYFTAVEPEVITGQSIHEEGTFATIDYNGNIEVGIQLKVTWVSGDAPSFIGIQIGDPAITYFLVDASVDADTDFEMSSIPMHKYVRNIDLNTSLITNLLDKVHIEEGSSWPTLLPGENHFHVITDAGVQDFQLTYFERFGGL